MFFPWSCFLTIYKSLIVGSYGRVSSGALFLVPLDCASSTLRTYKTEKWFTGIIVIHLRGFFFLYYNKQGRAKLSAGKGIPAVKKRNQKAFISHKLNSSIASNLIRSFLVSFCRAQTSGSKYILAAIPDKIIRILFNISNLKMDDPLQSLHFCCLEHCMA